MLLENFNGHLNSVFSISLQRSIANREFPPSDQQLETTEREGVVISDC